MEAIRSALRIAGWAGFVFAVLLDLHALYCGIRRNLRGHGPSGIPVLSLIVYVAICQYRQRFVDLLWLVLFHALCQYLIPYLHWRLIGGKREGTRSGG
ncbi:MAG: hypothetical protein AAB152_02145 [Candidatus Coatesbacteria bacterium]